jgi:hypothetical protein
MRLTCLILICIYPLQACNQNKKTEAILIKEVMDVHDEAMTKMGILRNLSKKLQLKLDSVEVGQNTKDKQYTTEIEEAVKKLQDANASMMEWMHQFEQIEEGTPHGEVLRYLTDQKRLIEEVREDMIGAKKAGDYYINL